MKRLCQAALLLLIAAASATPAPAADGASDRLQVGEKVKDFELPVVGENDYLRLSDQYKQGPVVVVVLRGFPGYQCPICNRQVSSMISRAGALDRAAHRVVLVYPGETADLQQRAEQFMGSRRLPEPLVMVRDEGMRMVRDWGLRWDEPRETAYPATYVIDRHGRVAWKKVSRSHAERSRVQEILTALRKSSRGPAGSR